MPYLVALGEWLGSVLRSQEAAGWAQAIGSIIAVIAAFMIANNQNRQDARRRTQDRADALTLPIRITDATIALVEREINRFERLDPTSLPKIIREPRELIWILGNTQHLNITNIQDTELLMKSLRLSVVVQEIMETFRGYQPGFGSYANPDGTVVTNEPWIVHDLRPHLNELKALRSAMQTRLIEATR